MICNHDITADYVITKELNYYRYLQPFQHMKTTSNDNIYMFSFCMHPNIHSNSGIINDVSSLALIFEKENGEQFIITDNSSITYVVQHC